MVRRAGRRLRRSTVREMLAIGFSNLKRRIKDACEEKILHFLFFFQFTF